MSATSCAPQRMGRQLASVQSHAADASHAHRPLGKLSTGRTCGLRLGLPVMACSCAAACAWLSTPRHTSCTTDGSSVEKRCWSAATSGAACCGVESGPTSAPCAASLSGPSARPSQPMLACGAGLGVLLGRAGAVSSGGSVAPLAAPGKPWAPGGRTRWRVASSHGTDVSSLLLAASSDSTRCTCCVFTAPDARSVSSCATATTTAGFSERYTRHKSAADSCAVICCAGDRAVRARRRHERNAKRSCPAQACRRQQRVRLRQYGSFASWMSCPRISRRALAGGQVGVADTKIAFGVGSPLRHNGQQRSRRAVLAEARCAPFVADRRVVARTPVQGPETSGRHTTVNNVNCNCQGQVQASSRDSAELRGRFAQRQCPVVHGVLGSSVFGGMPALLTCATRGT